jgi:F-type H+-transporting ATPase subunit delta
LNALPEIALQFKRLVNARSGSSDATIFSAFPMDAAAVDQIAQTIEKRFARKLSFSVELQPELIGGIRVVVGDEVLDTSVKSRLEQMKVALTA